jgi:hypothetical protein
LVTAFTLDAAAGRTADEILAAAWTKPSAERLRIPV